MPIIKIKSSNIHSIQYFYDDHNLEVGFNSGKLYIYHQVPEELFDQFTAAESKGTFFRKNIRGKFSYLCLGNTLDIWCERIESKARHVPLDDCRALDEYDNQVLQASAAKKVHLRFSDGEEFVIPYDCYLDRLADVAFIPAEM